MNNSLTIGQILVLNHIMSDYPRSHNFDSILSMIVASDDNITIWEPFTHWEETELLGFIKSLSIDIDSELEKNKRGEYTEKEFQLIFDDLMTLAKDDLAYCYINSMTREDITHYIKCLEDDEE
jgi:hypothetical protein